MTRNMVHVASQACPGWPVAQFRDEFRFLSNFYMCPVSFEDIQYPSAEHAYQAAKSVNYLTRREILECERPGDAKRYGRSVRLRPDWEQVRHSVMLQVVLAKFTGHPDLASALRSTGDRLLIEGNTWGDTEWGAVPYAGQPDLPVWRIGETNATWLAGYNWLGWTLMVVRDVLAGNGVVPR